MLFSSWQLGVTILGRLQGSTFVGGDDFANWLLWLFLDGWVWFTGKLGSFFGSNNLLHACALSPSFQIIPSTCWSQGKFAKPACSRKWTRQLRPLRPFLQHMTGFLNFNFQIRGVWGPFPFRWSCRSLKAQRENSFYLESVEKAMRWGGMGRMGWERSENEQAANMNIGFKWWYLQISWVPIRSYLMSL